MPRMNGAVLLVGSVPAETATEAMRTCAEGVGHCLINAKIQFYVVDPYEVKRPAAKGPGAWYGATRRPPRA